MKIKISTWIADREGIPAGEYEAELYTNKWGETKSYKILVDNLVHYIPMRPIFAQVI